MITGFRETLCTDGWKNMKNKMTPNYKKIYTDLVERKFPQRKNECSFLLNKDRLEFMDVIHLNDLLFHKKNRQTQEMNQKYRSYDQHTILWILSYQKKHELNNTELSNQFKISRNTINSWRKIFSHKI